jgi:plastocyanin
MNTATRIIISVIILALIGGGIIWYLSSRTTENTTPPPPTPTTTTPDTNNTAEDESAPAASTTITYDGNNFVPASLRVAVGATITVINNSSRELDFASDPHPTHTNNSELNEGSIAPGESREFTVTEKGTWGFHDHLNASAQGTLIVE